MTNEPHKDGHDEEDHQIGLGTDAKRRLGGGFIGCVWRRFWATEMVQDYGDETRDDTEERGLGEERHLANKRNRGEVQEWNDTDDKGIGERHR